MEIKLTLDGSGVLAAARASDPKAGSGSVVLPLDKLRDFGEKLARAAARQGAIDKALRQEAWALHDALFRGKVRDVYVHMRALLGGVGARGLLVRLVFPDPAQRDLQAIPWEALCERDTEKYLGTSADIVVVRDLSEAGEDVWGPAPSPIRPLLVSSLGDPELLLAALEERRRDGALERLEPLVGDRATPLRFSEALRQYRSRRPNLLHLVGHGSRNEQRSPVLLLGDGAGGHQGIPFASLASDLRATFDDLRLILLDSCSGADPGPFCGAVEPLLTMSGARAVVAYLWPVDPKSARICSEELYQLLCGAGDTRGDIAASLNGARRQLAKTSDGGHPAEAFSPVLYLLGTSSALFKMPETEAAPRVLRSESAVPPLCAFTKELRERLLAIVKDIAWPRDVLLCAYRESAPAEWRFLFEDASDGNLAGKMILKLEDAFITSTGAHPLLDFVAVLIALAAAPAASWTHPEQVSSLVDWAALAKDHLGLSELQRDALRRRAHEVERGFAKQETYIDVALETVDQDRYRVHAFRVAVRGGRAESEPIEFGEDREYGFDELEALVAQQMTKLAKVKPVVELVVPVELLARCRADQWRIHHGISPRRTSLGAAYRVVLRSWERCYENEEFWEAWQQRWRRFLAPPDQARACVCVDKVAELPSSSDHGAVKLRLPPDSDELAMLLEDGTPVAVWPREGAAEALDECLSMLPSGAQAPDWRELVRQHRRSATEKHLDECLVLLWDDFDRRPPNPGERSSGPVRRTGAA
ncbi:CHAT domain-containing protein [Sorangium cellulosum]|nr:CHAT domain-containing protein [Sorangium cellulosum]